MTEGKVGSRIEKEARESEKEKTQITRPFKKS